MTDENSERDYHGRFKEKHKPLNPRSSTTGRFLPKPEPEIILRPDPIIEVEPEPQPEPEVKEPEKPKESPIVKKPLVFRRWDEFTDK